MARDGDAERVEGIAGHFLSAEFQVLHLELSKERRGNFLRRLIAQWSGLL